MGHPDMRKGKAIGCSVLVQEEFWTNEASNSTDWSEFDRRSAC